MTQKKLLYIMLPISLIGVILGSFFDLSLSQAVCNQESMYGIILAGFGQVPCMLAFLASAALAVASFDKEKLPHSIGMLVLAVLDLIATKLYFDDCYDNFKNKVLATVICIAICLTFTVFVYVYVDKSNKDRLRKIALFLFLTPLLVYVVYELIKQFRGRPRYRMIITRDDISFENWWDFSSTVKSQYADVIAKDEFKSFPSCHAASAAATLILPVLCKVVEPLRKRENILFVICAIFPILVAFARIVTGAHFLSDVSFGLIVAIVVMLIMEKIFKYDEL